MKKILKKITATMSGILAGVLAIGVSGYTVADSQRGTLDSALGTTSWKVVTKEANDENLYTFDSLKEKSINIDGKEVQVDTSTLKGLFTYEKDVSMRLAAEGAVLLKNDNNALPLNTADKKNVTLLGSRSYSNIVAGTMWGQVSYKFYGFQFGGLMGSVAPAQIATDFPDALRAKGFTVNETVEAAYETWLSNKANYPDAGWNGAAYKVNESNPTDIGLETMNASFGDTAIVTVGRPAREQGAYFPGEEGKMDPTEFDADKDVLGLSKDELATLQFAKDNFETVIVLINAVSMDIPELEDYADAIMWVGMPGVYGLEGISRLLDGTLSPSGRMSDTYAAKASNTIAMVNMQYSFESANGVEINNKTYNNQYYSAEVESIYTDYRYYESRYYDTVVNKRDARAAVGATGNATSWNYNNEVVYPYGYGLSYTTFSETIDDVKVDYNAQTVTAKVTVKNEGSVAGKHVVELYAQTPYAGTAGSIEKSAIQLIGFDKTQTLAPNESEQLTIVADFQDFASWDDTLEHHAVKGAFVLEEGDYYFTVGNGANEATNNVLAKQGYTVANSDGYMTADGDDELVEVVAMKRVEILESKAGVVLQNQMDDMDPAKAFADQGVKNFSRTSWNANWPKVYDSIKPTAALKDGLMNQVYTLTENGDPSTVKFGVDNGLKYTDLKPAKGEKLAYDDPRLQMYVEQYDLDDAVVALLNGDSWSSGPTTVAGQKQAQPLIVLDDGPMGFDSYKASNGVGVVGEKFDASKDPDYETYGEMPMRTLPVGVVIGATWNTELTEEAGRMMGQLALWSGVTGVQGPGSNTHRNAYNARNHEYYSADGLHCGLMMDAYCAGTWSQGLAQTVKHFAFNDTEVNRSSIGAYMSEQRAREIEFRAFQVGIERKNVVGIMMGMNRAGAYFVGAHEGIMQGIIRGEWAFTGLIETDMTAGKHDNARDSLAMGVDSMLEKISKKYDAKWELVVQDSIEGDSSIAYGKVTEELKKDTFMLTRIQEALKHITWVYVNSNIMNGKNGSSELVKVNTWWDNAFIAVIAGSAILMVACVAGNIALNVKDDEEE